METHHGNHWDMVLVSRATGNIELCRIHLIHGTQWMVVVQFWLRISGDQARTQEFPLVGYDSVVSM